MLAKPHGLKWNSGNQPPVSNTRWKVIGNRQKTNFTKICINETEHGTKNAVIMAQEPQKKFISTLISTRNLPSSTSQQQHQWQSYQV